MRDGSSVELRDNDTRAAWADLVSRYDWTIFATLTFSMPQHSVFRCHEFFTHWLNRWGREEATKRQLCSRSEHPQHDAYGRQVGLKVRHHGPYANAVKKQRQYIRPPYVLGIEPHKSGALHMHAVIREPSFFKDEWERRLGWRLWSCSPDEGGSGLGISRIEPPRESMSVVDYVTKYVTKGSDLILGVGFDAASGLGGKFPQSAA